MRPEEDPLSELWDREDLVTDIWLYRHVTRNPETGQADPELVIFLEQGRVRSLAIVGGLSGGTELVIFLEQGRVRQILYPPSASTTR